MEHDRRDLQQNSPFFDPILHEIEVRDTGTSHNVDHAQHVLQFALILRQLYGGDIDVLTAATLLHDQGRVNKSYTGETSINSRQLSVAIAQQVLQSIQFPQEKIPFVLSCILEHDQTDAAPTTLESAILRDADYLDGFGANGILRSAIWTGETGGDMQALLDRLGRKMRQRIQTLTFEESRTYATRQYAFVQLFLRELTQREFDLPQHTGDYIVIEGISGAGKSTQTSLLAAYLAEHHKQVLHIKEPTGNYPLIKQAFANRRDAIARMLMFLADRYVYLQDDIQDQLQDGGIVLSDRSFISTLVYQGTTDQLSPEEIAYFHKYVAQPSLIIVLDTDPIKAYQRLQQRYSEESTAKGEHEALEKLTQHREAFLQLQKLFPQLHIINIDGKSIEEVFAQIKDLLVAMRIIHIP